jgi:hypothetical protein
MQFDKPIWELVSPRCGHCEEGELTFVRCPACAVIALHCGECGTIYAVEQKQPGRKLTGSARCFACAGPLHQDFSAASAEEIQASGFLPGEYR